MWRICKDVILIITGGDSSLSEGGKTEEIQSAKVEGAEDNGSEAINRDGEWTYSRLKLLLEEKEKQSALRRKSEHEELEVRLEKQRKELMAANTRIGVRLYL